MIGLTSSARRRPTALGRFVLATVAAVGGALGGCGRERGEEVVVYTALDSEFSQPIFDRFTEQTGIRVRPKFDTEATKTVGLANAIIAEAKRPRCDVYWNNEILNTLRLQHRGLLAPFTPDIAEEYPVAFRSAEGAWHGFAARARILIVNTQLVDETKWPDSILDLADARWRGRTGIAKPLFGTTATHAACLFAVNGEAWATQFFTRLKANGVQVLSGNKQVALAVSSGRLAFGLTDTDDALGEINKGLPVTIVYPDQGEGMMGTLFIPNTVAIVQGGPNPEAAKKLAAFLLSREVESRLAVSPSGQIPLNPHVETRPIVETPQTIAAMEVDFDRAAELWSTTAALLTRRFTTP